VAHASGCRCGHRDLTRSRLFLRRPDLVAHGAPLAATLAVWMASIALTLEGALGVRYPALTGLRRPARASLLRAGAVTGVLVLAVALRLPHLASVPPDVHGDEAAVGLDARALLHGGWGGLFGLGWAGVPQRATGSLPS